MPVTINGTTGISGIDGTAGTPSVIGSDADTGFFFSAGVVSASLNGVAGNVPLVQGTAQNSTSGTSIDFTGIPSWAKRVTVMFNGVSTNGTSHYLVQLGAGSITATGYSSYFGYVANDTNANSTSATTGLGWFNGNASNTDFGHYYITLISGNTWVSHCCGATVGGTAIKNGGGSVTLSGTLDRIRITTVNGTDTFDAGSINILYE